MTPSAIVVAFDFSEPSRRALEWARLLRARLHASVTVVHVDDAAALGVRGAVEHTADAGARRARWLTDELRGEVAKVFGPEEQAVRVHVANGIASERLAELALELDADLLIAGATGKSAVERVLLGSVSAELARSSAIPVMTVP